MSEEKKTKGKKPPNRAAIGSDMSATRIGYKDRNKITVADQDPDYKYRVVNDDNEHYQGNVAKRKQMGYDIVTDESTIGDDQGVGAHAVGSQVSRHVGHGTKGILMRQRKEWFEEDKAAKQAEIDANVQTIAETSLDGEEGITGEVSVKTGIQTKVT